MKFLKCVLAIIEKHFGHILIAIAIIAAAIIYANFNPYESCKRDIADWYWAPRICSGSN